jgi:hypothetical protein
MQHTRIRPEEVVMHPTSGTQPAKTRRPRLRRAVKALAAGTAVAVLSAGTAAWAVPTFSDVPESHPFYEEIEWMAATGISEGYPDGTYRPTEPVTRQAMSAFMQRLFDLQDTTYAVVDASEEVTTSTSWQPLGLTKEVSVPDGTRGWLHADVTAESACSGGSGYCQMRILYQRVGGGPTTEMWPQVGEDFAFDSSDNDTESSSSWEGHAMSRSTLGPLLPGTYQVWVEYKTSTGPTTFRLDDTRLGVLVDVQTSSFQP